jgi:hypothetical protein
MPTGRTGFNEVRRLVSPSFFSCDTTSGCPQLVIFKDGIYVLFQNHLHIRRPFEDILSFERQNVNNPTRNLRGCFFIRRKQ